MHDALTLLCMCMQTIVQGHSDHRSSFVKLAFQLYTGGCAVGIAVACGSFLHTCVICTDILVLMLADNS